MLTPEQIANFPVAHLSPSAIRCYLNDRQMFFRQYVRYEFDNTSSPSLIEGSAVHYALENYYTDIKDNNGVTKSPEAYVQIAIDKLAELADTEQVEWGKTGTLDDSKRKVTTCLDGYFNEISPLKPLAVEQKIVASFTELPIPIKAVSDLVCEEDADIVIIDHKTVSSFSDINAPINPNYIIQAVCNFWTVWFEYNRKPARMYFDEIKKSKNRDGSPQVQRVVVEFTDDIVIVVKAIYDRIIRELSGLPLIDENGIMNFLPNPSAQYGVLDSWNDFCSEVLNMSTFTLDSVKELRNNKPDEMNIEAVDI